MHVMTDYTEGLVIGHNTLQSDCSMSAICHSYSHSLTHYSHLSIRIHTCLCLTVIAGSLQVMAE
jgi:hypothetical protein